ncbi:hypothetical protein QTP86_018950, partial [Hemibagrus guttatus]
MHVFGLGEETGVPGGNPRGTGRTCKLHTHGGGGNRTPNPGGCDFKSHGYQAAIIGPLSKTLNWSVNLSKEDDKGSDQTNQPSLTTRISEPCVPMTLSQLSFLGPLL